jgi:hypothetical protein
VKVGIDIGLNSGRTCGEIQKWETRLGTKLSGVPWITVPASFLEYLRGGIPSLEAVARRLKSPMSISEPPGSAFGCHSHVVIRLDRRPLPLARG